MVPRRRSFRVRVTYRLAPGDHSSDLRVNNCADVAEAVAEARRAFEAENPGADVVGVDCLDPPRDPGPRSRVGVRLPRSLADRVARRAAAEGVSISDYVVRRLADAADAAGDPR